MSWTVAWTHPCCPHCSTVLELLRADLRPRDIMTRAAFENAMTVVMALGGSTNAVLHLLAMARAAGVALSLDDFQVLRDFPGCLLPGQAS